MTSLAVIIVNYGTADLTIRAVDSVLTSRLDDLEVAVHVVDNNAPGEDAATLTRAAEAGTWGDRVTLYLESENHGFGRGNNLVLRGLAGGQPPPELVFFLNPDARVEPTTIHDLVEFLTHHPDASVAGCKILDPDTKKAVTSAFRFPTILNEFVGAIQFGPVSRLFPKAHVAMGAQLPKGQVDWVAGAAFLARFACLQRIGFFDDDFFLYYEEVDMMRRLHSVGGEIWYVPETCVRHVAGAATGLGGNGKIERKRLPPYWYESWYLYMIKQHGRAYALSCAWLKLLGWTLNLAISRLRGKDPAAPRHFLPDFWTYALRPLVTGKGERSK